jgi:organic hydroperoxide reductase OsmC/OhrA
MVCWVNPVQAKRFEYAAAVDRAGRISTKGGGPVALPDGWSPEALVLAGLAWCVLISLAYHTRREGRDVTASAATSGVVTKRESDGRYAFVEVRCEIEAEVEPAPPGDELAALIAKAERDCFISASLTTETAYSWQVNGEVVAA